MREAKWNIVHLSEWVLMLTTYVLVSYVCSIQFHIKDASSFYCLKHIKPYVHFVVSYSSRGSAETTAGQGFFLSIISANGWDVVSVKVYRIISVEN